MKILLINTNPVVSRLLILCTRDESIMLDEVKNYGDVGEEDYDIVFVDEDSYSQETIQLFHTQLSSKKVLLSYHDNNIDGFDLTIKKPFLPSQIIEQIESVKSMALSEISDQLDEEESEEMTSIFPLSSEDEELVIGEVPDEETKPAVLDVNEIEKIKALLDMDDTSETVDNALSDEEIEARKLQVITEQLLSEGVEIVDEKEIVDEFFDDFSIDIEGNVVGKKKKIKAEFTEADIEDAIREVMSNLTKKQKKKLLKGKEIEVSIKLEDRD